MHPDIAKSNGYGNSVMLLVVMLNLMSIRKLNICCLLSYPIAPICHLSLSFEVKVSKCMHAMGVCTLLTSSSDL